VAAGLELGERGVVRVVVGDRDLDAGLGLELLDELGRGVVAPVVELELLRGGACGEEARGRASLMTGSVGG
jgi:hypothetical protein